MAADKAAGRCWPDHGVGVGGGRECDGEGGGGSPSYEHGEPMKHRGGGGGPKRWGETLVLSCSGPACESMI